MGASLKEAKRVDSRIWYQEMLDVMQEEDLRYLAYLPDGVLAPLITEAEKRSTFRLIPLTREEEGVGILSGIHLGGRRGVLAMQTTGMGNCLNAIGSLNLAQRIPLLMIVTERGGLGENVMTQIPFGQGLRRVLESVGIQYHEIDHPWQVRQTLKGAAETAFICRVPVVLLLTYYLSKGNV